MRPPQHRAKPLSARARRWAFVSAAALAQTGGAQVVAAYPCVAGFVGAVLGLLFGLTGFFLNHRATLKVPGVSDAKTHWQLQLPQPLPSRIGDLSQYLQQSLDLHKPPTRQKVEHAGPTPWPGATQPEHWQIAFNTLQHSVNAEYWVGNSSVSVERVDPSLLSTLTRLHKGSGAGLAWMLFVDTLAGTLMVLSITGVLLWAKLHGPRLLAMGWQVPA